jgi:hypothetical protein
MLLLRSLFIVFGYRFSLVDRAESNCRYLTLFNVKHPPCYPFAKNPTPTCYPMLMCPALLPTFCSNEHSSLVGLPRPTKHFVLAQICFSIVATYRKESIVSRLMSASIPNLGDDNLSNPFAFSFAEPSETLCHHSYLFALHLFVGKPLKVTTELQLLTMSKNSAIFQSYRSPAVPNSKPQFYRMGDVFRLVLL